MEPGRYIIVLQRRFVLVAEVPPNQKDNLLITLGKSAIVRRWGTSEGLGELANKGPLPDTILDKEPKESKIALFAIIRCIPCSEEWNSWFSK